MNLPHSQFLEHLFARQSESHKYDYGRILVVGGSRSMAGAPVLAGRAALRSGAGMVELCVPECIAAVAASFDPCLITHHYASNANGCFALEGLEDLYQLALRADVIVCGPGLGRSAELTVMIEKLWSAMPRTMIFDADALYALSRLDKQALAGHAGSRIITPHAGEMQRFAAETIQRNELSSIECREKLEQAAQEFAGRNNAIVVLKGPQTLITDGSRNVHNANGNPGMATAGSGDVLAGIIAALIGQGMPSFEASHIAVQAHGVSGDLAAEALTELSMTANDIIDYLPRAWRTIQCGLGSG